MAKTFSPAEALSYALTNVEMAQRILNTSRGDLDRFLADNERRIAKGFATSYSGLVAKAFRVETDELALNAAIRTALLVGADEAAINGAMSFAR